MRQVWSNEVATRLGRLIVSLDSDVNLFSIHAVAKFILERGGEFTPEMIAGAKPDVVKDLAKRWPKAFHNHNDIQDSGCVARLLPWAEVWVVQAGKMRELSETEHQDLIDGLDNQALQRFSLEG